MNQAMTVAPHLLGGRTLVILDLCTLSLLHFTANTSKRPATRRPPPP